MNLKQLFRTFEEDPKKHGLYSLSVRIYNDSEDGLSASVFVSVTLEHIYDCEPDGIRHRDFMELLSGLQDCIGFNYINGSITNSGIYLRGWL